MLCHIDSNQALAMFSGLLLYNGESDTGRDFFSFGMSAGRAEFRFNLGSGTVIIQSQLVSLDTWHTARLKRVRSQGIIDYHHSVICPDCLHCNKV